MLECLLLVKFLMGITVIVCINVHDKIQAYIPASTYTHHFYIEHSTISTLFYLPNLNNHLSFNILNL